MSGAAGARRHRPGCAPGTRRRGAWQRRELQAAAAALAAAGTVAWGAGCATLPGGGAAPGAAGSAATQPARRVARAGIPRRIVEAVSPLPDPRFTRELPPIPRREGLLTPRVEYPDSLRLVADVDSSFVFGSVGTGSARLTVNGVPVPVEPNGSFIAWLPVPRADSTLTAAHPEADGPVARYTLIARKGAVAETLRHPIRRPRGLPDRASREAAWIDTTSLADPPLRWVLPEEEVELAVRAAPMARVWAEVGERRFHFRSEPGSPRHRLRVKAGRLAAASPRFGTPVAGIGPKTVRLRVRAASGGDTARLDRSLRLRVLDPEALPLVSLVEEPDTVQGERRLVIGRTHPYGTYYWRFPEGTRAAVDRREGPRFRVRLTEGLTAWVAEEDVVPLPASTGPPRTQVDRVTVRPEEDRLRVELPLDAPVPLKVKEPDGRTVVLELYGATGSTSRASYGEVDPFLESVDWEQRPGSVYRLEIGLARRTWGHRTRYRVAYDGSATLVLDIRRPPRIDRGRPLSGRRVAVDPGHPGAGAYGPTGYYEGDANLAVALHLVRMLEAAGAEPLLIRKDTMRLGLYERRRRAVTRGAELFVSLHNNALPDGVRPFGNHGTSTYYFHPHSRDLARAVQRGMLETMGLRDLGVFYGNLAVARTSWMPAVLAEGAFMMMPRQEAALKRDAFQKKYARGVLRGLRQFLRDRARPR